MPESIDEQRRRFIGLAAAALGAARLGVLGTTVQQMACAALTTERALPSLSGATQWLNSPPLTPADLRGKVVLVDFWTYTCVNWLRTLPYVRAWAEKYRDRGLVVIGVHTPEFPFERDIAVSYPIAVDSDYSVWRAFDNNYWPAVYLADANGRIRYQHFGEGAYDETERVIQRLVRESGPPADDRLVSVTPRGLEVAADYDTLRSPETYLGYQRSHGFASPGDALQDAPRVYARPGKLAFNQWALSGDWTVKGRAAALHKAGGRVVHRFHARDVNLIFGPPSGSPPVRFVVSIDGQPPGTAHGSDVDDRGNGTANRQRAYQLVRQREPIAEREFEIEFLAAGVETFAFTFG
jgi:thiol-disulfide isomerase/thioredoxin